MRIELSTFSSNSPDGVQLPEQSSAWFSTLSGPNVMTGSGFQNVSVNDLSFAIFDPGNSITTRARLKQLYGDRQELKLEDIPWWRR